MCGPADTTSPRFEQPMPLPAHPPGVTVAVDSHVHFHDLRDPAGLLLGHGADLRHGAQHDEEEQQHDRDHREQDRLDLAGALGILDLAGLRVFRDEPEALGGTVVEEIFHRGFCNPRVLQV